MRYLVRARIKPGKDEALLPAIADGTLGAGSVAGAEYIRVMKNARLCDDGTARWVEICFCSAPLEEERPYWEEFFELIKIQDAHARTNCRDKNGTEPWSCINCDCTEKLETTMETWGVPFLSSLERNERDENV